MTIRLGPDSARYWLAAEGNPVARPFHLRWLLPRLLGPRERRWWVTWAASWLLVAGGVAALATGRGATLTQAAAAAAMCLLLPGLWGPKVVRPVGVDLPSMAVGVWAAAAVAHGYWWAAIPLVLLAGCVKESAPVWAALWAWNPLLLVGLVAPAIRSLIAKPELDRYTAQPNLRAVHDHPVQTALHARSWRDAWVMVAPWGATLACLYRPSLWLLVTLAVAHAQLLVATDTVRLVHTAAGPAAAIAAATVIPTHWLPLAIVLASYAWWRTPEVV